MPKPYPPEFRRRALDLFESGRSVRDVAASLSRGAPLSEAVRWANVAGSRSVREAEHVAFWAGDNRIFHACSEDEPIQETSYVNLSSHFIGAYRLLGVETVASCG